MFCVHWGEWMRGCSRPKARVDRESGGFARAWNGQQNVFFILYFVPSSTRTSFLVCCCWFGEISFLILDMDYIPDMTHVSVKILIKSQFMWIFLQHWDRYAGNIHMGMYMYDFTYIMYMINWPFLNPSIINILSWIIMWKKIHVHRPPGRLSFSA